MSPMEFLLLAILAVPAVGLMVSGVLLIRVRDRFSPKGYAVAPGAGHTYDLAWCNTCSRFLLHGDQPRCGNCKHP